MKLPAVLLMIMLFFNTPTISAQSSVLSGKVTNEDGSVVPFTNISIQELSMSTFSDGKGNYLFASIPEGTYHIYITRNGYLNTTLRTSVTDRNTILNIILEKSLLETPTIDVTSSFAPDDISNSTFSITSISSRTLTSIRNENIASTIQNIPGVNNLSTGNSIGKPVIRGLTSQSVIIVHDGVKHESQQWGDEHAPEISLFDLDRIEIMRGPASLIYGSDGIGGVVNIISKPLQFSGKQNKLIAYGTLDLNGFSMNTEGTGNFTIGIGMKTLGIKGHIGFRKGQDIKTPDGEFTINTPNGIRIIEGGKLFNTGNEEFEGGIKMGYKRKFGSISAEYQNFNREIQIHEDPLEQTGALANQKIVTNHIEAKGSFHLNKFFQLEPILSYETQQRKEFESIGDKENDNPSLNLHLKIFQGDLRFSHQLVKDIKGTIGASIIDQNNESLGEEKLIPNYDARNYGIYLLEKYEKKHITLAFGVRYDYRLQKIKKTIFETDSNSIPLKVVPARDLKFSSFTGSLGIVYKLFYNAEVFVNAGSAWRPPSEFDMYADGVHEGTGRFDRGLITLDSTLNPNPERSFNLDIGARIRMKYFNAEISFFRNLIVNFIYPTPTEEIDSSSGLPVYNLKQARSTFLGYEYNLQIQPAVWSVLSIRGDYVRTENNETGNPLSFTPPSKNIVELKLQKNNIGKLYNPFINFSIKIVSSQTRVDPLEAVTKGYTLLGAGAGFDFVLSKSIASIDVSVSNLTNKKYVDHLSRYKYFAMNPGRSFNLKISIPFQF